MLLSCSVFAHAGVAAGHDDYCWRLYHTYHILYTGLRYIAMYCIYYIIILTCFYIFACECWTIKLGTRSGVGKYFCIDYTKTLFHILYYIILYYIMLR